MNVTTSKPSAVAVHRAGFDSMLSVPEYTIGYRITPRQTQTSTTKIAAPTVATTRTVQGHA